MPIVSPSTAAAAPDLVGEIDAFLQELLTEPEPDSSPGPGRPRVLPALVLWGSMLVCILRGETSQRAIWRRLSLLGLWQYPRYDVTDEAVYQRLARAGTTDLEALFAQVTTVLAARLATWPVLGAADLAPFARAVVAIDETTLDPVARSLPALRATPGPDRLPGKVAGVFDLRTQQWCTVRTTTDPHQNEKVLARDLVADLPARSLILADLGYFGFRWFDDLTDAGHHWVSRARAKTSYQVIHTAYAHGETRDELVWLGAHRADRAKHAVRRVQFRVGQTLYCYLTNVTDPHLLPAADLARLYARRWDIELAVKLVKRELGLHLLWSAKPAVVWQQVWAVLIIAQIVQALRLEVAGRAGVDPFAVSLPLLVQVLPQLLARGEDPIAVLVARGRHTELIRPSRRLRTVGPTIDPAALAHPPPDLVLTRTPRYARRKCGAATRVAAAPAK